MVLLVGYVLLALLLTTVVAAASSLYIGQKKLLSIADGAAMAAADGFTLGAAPAGGGPPEALLSTAQVNRAVAQYLDRSAGYAAVASLSVDPRTGTPDGRTAQVSLRAVVHPLFANFLIPGGITITASSTARSQLVK